MPNKDYKHCTTRITAAAGTGLGQYKKKENIQYMHKLDPKG